MIQCYVIQPQPYPGIYDRSQALLCRSQTSIESDNKPDLAKSLWGRPELSSFSQEYTEYAVREGVNGHCTLLKNADYDAFHFHTGLLKINILKVLFWEGGRVSQKEYSVYAFHNVDNYGRSLSSTPTPTERITRTPRDFTR